jgi:hypothetical protein
VPPIERRIIADLQIAGATDFHLLKDGVATMGPPPRGHIGLC